MIVNLEHLFLRRCIDPDSLLKGCQLINSYVNRYEKQSLKFSNVQDEQNHYVGWALEIFSEFLCKTFPFDKLVGINNYKIVDEDDDTGVDGYGIGIDLQPATVQIKHRQANYILTANNDNLTNFTSTSMMKYGVTTKDENNKNMLIITTAQDIHWHTYENMLCRNVRILNREKLRALLDNNLAFWYYFQKSWIDSLEKSLHQ